MGFRKNITERMWAHSCIVTSSHRVCRCVKAATVWMIYVHFSVSV